MAGWLAGCERKLQRAACVSQPASRPAGSASPAMIYLALPAAKSRSHLHLTRPCLSAFRHDTREPPPGECLAASRLWMRNFTFPLSAAGCRLSAVGRRLSAETKTKTKTALEQTQATTMATPNKCRPLPGAAVAQTERRLAAKRVATARAQCRLGLAAWRLTWRLHPEGRERARSFLVSRPAGRPADGH